MYSAPAAAAASKSCTLQNAKKKKKSTHARMLEFSLTVQNSKTSTFPRCQKCVSHFLQTCFIMNKRP